MRRAPTRAPRAGVTTWVGTPCPVTAGHGCRHHDDVDVTPARAGTTAPGAPGPALLAASVLGAVAVVAALLGASLHVAALGRAAAGGEAARSFWLMSTFAGLAYGSTALLLARRRAAPALAVVVGLVGALQAVSLVVGEVTAPLLDEGARGTAVTVLVWLASWLWSPAYVLLVAVLPLLLPDGRLLSPRWRGALGLSVVAVLLTSAWWALLPYQAQDLPVAPADVRNPVGVDLSPTRRSAPSSP